MSLLATLRIALNALRINKLRSALTMLGIIIGVAAVIVMIAIGTGAQERVKEQVRSLGSNIMIVLPGSILQSGVRLGSGATQTLTEDDAQAIQREVPEVQVASGTNRGSAQVVAGGSNWATTVYGITPEFLDVREWAITSGRGFEAGELSGSGKVALIGLTVARQLFGDADPLDQQIRIKNVPHTIIGVLDRKGQSSQGQDQDDVIMVPLSTARNRLFGQGQGRLRRVSTILVKVQQGQDMKVAENNMRDLLRQRHKLQEQADDDFSIRNLSELLQVQEAASNVMAILLASVASVSLLVGGIGIMNIMLVSVTERTREIGLRMAVGARSRDILLQFLVEALTLSLIGGIVGIVLGVAGTYVVAQLASWPTQLQFKAIALAAGFAAAIGIFFGWYPARKAANLLPIQALRYE
ncbi:ABC transporter permease [Ampullimonas aquatilis]|uniref:ABC transporter permease n=1 Tax=Ampullimonas aquatilis TaxID=1341549 RepID=UPI003C75402B